MAQDYDASNQLISKHYHVGGKRGAKFGQYDSKQDDANESWRGGYQPPPKSKWYDADGTLKCSKPASVARKITHSDIFALLTRCAAQTPLYVFRHKGDWLAQHQNAARMLYQGRTLAARGTNPTNPNPNNARALSFHLIVLILIL